MLKWTYYTEPFDTNNPPPAPPNRTGVMGFAGWIQTDDSKKETGEYSRRLAEYGCELRNGTKTGEACLDYDDYLAEIKAIDNKYPHAKSHKVVNDNQMIGG